MRSLYWAADHAVTNDSGRAMLGLEVLGALVIQADADQDARGRRVVALTERAVHKVAIPTFMSVVLNAVRTDDDVTDPDSSDGANGGGTVLTTAVEINAARLLLAHAPELSAAIRADIEKIAHASTNREVHVSSLLSREHDQPAEPTSDREYDRGRSYPSGPSLGW